MTALLRLTIDGNNKLVLRPVFSNHEFSQRFNAPDHVSLDSLKTVTNKDDEGKDVVFTMTTRPDISVVPALLHDIVVAGSDGIWDNMPIGVITLIAGRVFSTFVTYSRQENLEVLSQMLVMAVEDTLTEFLRATDDREFVDQQMSVLKELPHLQRKPPQSTQNDERFFQESSNENRFAGDTLLNCTPAEIFYVRYTNDPADQRTLLSPCVHNVISKTTGLAKTGPSSISELRTMALSAALVDATKLFCLMNYFVKYHNEIFKIHKRVISLLNELESCRRKLRLEGLAVKRQSDKLLKAPLDNFDSSVDEELESDSDEEREPRRQNPNNKRKRGKADRSDAAVRKISMHVKRIEKLKIELRTLSKILANLFEFALETKLHYDKKQGKLFKKGKADPETFSRAQRLAEQLGYFPVGKVYGPEDAKLNFREKVVLSVYSLRKISFEKDSMENDAIEIGAKPDDLTAVVSVIGFSESDPVPTNYSVENQTFEDDRSKFVRDFLQAANYWIGLKEEDLETHSNDKSFNLI